MSGGPEQVEHTADHGCIEVRKSFRPAIQGNPSMLEVSWTDPRDHRVVSAAGERLLAACRAFLSQRVARTFVGCALSQSCRIRAHRGRFLTPPRREPTRADSGRPERAVIPRDELGAAAALNGDGRMDELTPRAALEAQHGYDTKHAMVLVRLVRMGEILRDGLIHVRRADREELLAIREGQWSFERFEAYCQDVEAAIAGAQAVTTLPAQPDEAALDALCVSPSEEVLAC